LVEGSGIVQGSGFKVQSLGFRVQGLEFRVWGVWSRVVVSNLGIENRGFDTRVLGF
jgi:hypothetical protein